MRGSKLLLTVGAVLLVLLIVQPWVSSPAYDDDAGDISLLDIQQRLNRQQQRDNRQQLSNKLNKRVNQHNDDDTGDAERNDDDGDDGADEQGVRIDIDDPDLIEQRQQQHAEKKFVDPEKMKTPMEELPDLWHKDNDMLRDGLYPRLIGIGAQKSGSSSLFVYLSALKHFQKPVMKELHGFRGDRIKRSLVNFSPDGMRASLNSSLNWYTHKWAQANLSMSCDNQGRCKGNAVPDKVPFEVTPRYLSDMKVPFNMMKQLPHAKEVKFILIIRNPVRRAWSVFFQSTPKHMHTPEIFHNLIAEEMDIIYKCYNRTLGAMTFGRPEGPGKIGMRNLKVCRDPWQLYRELAECTQEHSDVKKPWFLKYTAAYDIAFRSFDVMEQTPYEGFAMRGIYVDQLLSFLCAGFKPDKFIIMTNAEVRRDALAAVTRIANHVNVPVEIEREKPYRKGVKRLQRSKGDMPVETKNMLERLYEPYNHLLLNLLETNGFDANLTDVRKELFPDK